MSVGLRFGIGPLVAYVPLTGGGKKKGRRRPSAAQVAAQKERRAQRIESVLKGAWVVLMWLFIWPYLVTRILGAQAGMSDRAAIIVGVAATAVWLTLAMIFGESP